MSLLDTLLTLLTTSPRVLTLGLTSSILLYLLRPRPHPLIPIHPGSLPIFAHSLSLLRHFLAKGEFAGWYANVIASSGGPGRIVQVLIVPWYPV